MNYLSPESLKQICLVDILFCVKVCFVLALVLLTSALTPYCFLLH